MLKHLLRFSDTYMPLLTLIIYLFQRKKIGDYHKWFLFFYLLFNTAIYGICGYMGYHYISNLYLYHIIHWAELVSVSYYLLILVLRKKRTVFFCVAGGYTIFELINIALWEPFFTVFNGNGVTIGNLTILLLSMYYMLQLSKSDDILDFQRLPVFWFVSAFLVSCALSTLALISYKVYVLLGISDQARFVWRLMNVTYILKFAFFIVGLLCYNRPPHRSSSQRPSLS